MIQPLQLHTSFAFEVRRYQDGPPVTISVDVTTNGIDEQGEQSTIDEVIALHMHALRELEEGKLGETVERRGVSVLIADAEGPHADPSELTRPGSPPTTSIHRPPDESPL